MYGSLILHDIIFCQIEWADFSQELYCRKKRQQTITLNSGLQLCEGFLALFYISHVTCYMPHVICHLSYSTCHMSSVICHMPLVICVMLNATCQMPLDVWVMSYATCHMSHVTVRSASLIHSLNVLVTDLLEVYINMCILVYITTMQTTAIVGPLDLLFNILWFCSYLWFWVSIASLFWKHRWILQLPRLLSFRFWVSWVQRFAGLASITLHI